jgi:hypothetical protein
MYLCSLRNTAEQRLIVLPVSEAPTYTFEFFRLYVFSMLIIFFKSAQQILLTAIVFLLRFLMSISFATTKTHLPNIASVTNMSPLFSNSKDSIPGTKRNLLT